MASDDVFDPYRRGGFDVFGQPTEGANVSPEQAAIFEEQQLREYEINSAIHRALTSPDGQVLLDFMRETATEGQRFDIANETDAHRAAAIGFFREGQAAFYFELTKRMNRALAGPPTVTNTEEGE